MPKNAEKFQKCRKISLMQKNSINSKKFHHECFVIQACSKPLKKALPQRHHSRFFTGSGYLLICVQVFFGLHNFRDNFNRLLRRRSFTTSLCIF
jgi:hypothetical protein